jgi:hypothetical protein
MREKAIRKLTLPVVHSHGDEEGGGKGEATPAIAELLKNCEPATFGHKGKEALDESYRHAVKLDETQFCTSFSPYDVGIVDAVAQTLLPAVARGAPGEVRDQGEYGRRGEPGERRS